MSQSLLRRLVEWNNPLDAMYGDIANVKTEIEGLSKDSSDYCPATSI